MNALHPAALTLVPSAQWNDAAYRARFDALYQHLQIIARRELRRAPRGTLNTSALVHEAYLKLLGDARDVSRDGPFLALAAKAMRCVLVDYMRAGSALKRGGDFARVTLATNLPLESPEAGIDVLDIERGLQALADMDPRLATVVECRFYGGMEFAEIARQLAVTERTVYRDWRRARAFLIANLGDAP